MTQYERAPSVSGEHPTAHSGEGRKGGAGAPIVGPVAPSGLLRVPCGCCTARVEGCGTSIVGPVAPYGLLRVSCGGAAPFTARLRITRVTDPSHQSTTQLLGLVGSLRFSVTLKLPR